MMPKENNIEPKHSNWNSDKILSVAAIFISLLSMLAISYQSYLAREENRLMKIQQSASVLPFLSVWFSDKDNALRFIIGNKGVGPAFIKEASFKLFDAEKKDTLYFDNSEILFRTIKQKSQLMAPIPMTTSTLKANMLLSAGEVKELFVLPTDKGVENYLLREEFFKFPIEVKIIYADVYGTQWYIGSSSEHPIKIED